MGNLQGPEWEELPKETHKPKSSNGLASVTTGLAAKFCDVLERAILWYFDDYSSKKDMHWLKGNYGPVPEMAPAADLPVSGVIPVRLIALIWSPFLEWEFEIWWLQIGGQCESCGWG